MDEVSLTRFGQAAFLSGLVLCLGALAWTIGTLSLSLASLFDAYGTATFSGTNSLALAFLAGLAVTVVLQSSSAASVLIINLVASSALSTQLAITAIFGANVGTVITPLLLSYAFAWKREALEGSLQVAWQHALFNLAGAATLLPIELAFHPLYRIAQWISPPDLVHESEAIPMAGVHLGTALMVLEVLLLVVLLWVIRWISLRLRRGTGRRFLDAAGSSSDALGLGLGILTTMTLQLSSATVSCLAAMGAAGAVRSKTSLPVILGANIGTTLTGILAAMALEGPLQAIAVLVALVHLLFNVVGTLLVLLVPPIRRGLQHYPAVLAVLCARHRVVGLLAMCAVWIGLPVALAILS